MKTRFYYYRDHTSEYFNNHPSKTDLKYCYVMGKTGDSWALYYGDGRKEHYGSQGTWDTWDAFVEEKHWIERAYPSEWKAPESILEPQSPIST